MNQLPLLDNSSVISPMPPEDASRSPYFLKPVRLSRDEMNLAEFPLTVLSTRSDSKIKTLEFHDTVRGKNGEVITRTWIITGADKFGLPTSSDDEVLLGLLKLTVDHGFHQRKVYFTRYELLRALRWTTEGRSYSRLQRALDRLSGVRIKATNAFYDNENKSHSTRNFGILDAYEINDGRDLSPKPSFFVWSEVIFKSFQVGFIKKLDLEFYLDLQSAVSKRLYRYLDKHFWYKSRIEINLFLLCHEKIGISRNYQYASALRQQLDPALADLTEKGFLGGFEFSGKGRESTVTLYSSAGRPRVQLLQKQAPAIAQDVVTTKSYKVAELLMERGLQSGQVHKLIAGKSEDTLERMCKIVEHFDLLCSTQSKLVSRSPVGFLYRAVENPDRFVLPGEGERRSHQTSLSLGKSLPGDSLSPGQRPPVKDGGSKTGTVAHTNRKKGGASEEAEYLIARQKEVQRIRCEVEPKLLMKMRDEVGRALANIKSQISPSRFEEALEHGVNEKLLQLYAFPSFQEWAFQERGRGR